MKKTIPYSLMARINFITHCFTGWKFEQDTVNNSSMHKKSRKKIEKRETKIITRSNA